VAQPSPFPEKSGPTFQPPCPKCGTPMWLMRLSKLDDTRDLRTFKCHVCEHTENKAVNFTADT
jgi:hypothetical protein